MKTQIATTRLFANAGIVFGGPRSSATPRVQP
jgi:hypothetical protein